MSVQPLRTAPWWRPALLMSVMTSCAQVGQHQGWWDLRLTQDGLKLHHEWWRLITGHWVHTNTPHLLMNMSSLWVLLALYRQAPSRPSGHQLVGLSLVLSGLTGLFLHIAHPEVSPYQGLSGVWHGLAVWLALHHWQSDRSRLSLALGALLSLKLMAEQASVVNTAPTAQWIGARVAIEGHLGGALAGLALHLCQMTLKRP